MRNAIGTGLALTLCAAQAAPGEEVTLQFGWRAGMRADVSFEGTRTRAMGGQERSQSASGSYRMETSADVGGIRISYSDFALSASGLPESAEPAFGDIQRLMTRAGSALPDFIVGPDGRLARVVGTEAMVEEVNAAFAELIDKLPEHIRERTRRAMTQLLTPRLIESRLTEDWNRDVGVWLEATLERGLVYETEASAPAPLLGNMPVPMKISYEYLGRAPCSTRHSGTGCVKLRLRSNVDSAKVGEALGAFVERLAAQGQVDFRIQSLVIASTVHVTTEPDTLIPYEIRTERDMAIAVERGGKAESTRQAQHRVIRYQYR